MLRIVKYRVKVIARILKEFACHYIMSLRHATTRTILLMNMRLLMLRQLYDGSRKEEEEVELMPVEEARKGGIIARYVT